MGSGRAGSGASSVKFITSLARDVGVDGRSGRGIATVERGVAKLVSELIDSSGRRGSHVVRWVLDGVNFEGGKEFDSV